VDCPGDSKHERSSPIELAAEIVTAFVSNNPLPKGEPPSLILAVHTALIRLAAEPESMPLQFEVKTPAVPIRGSITPDFLICLDDGKRFKSLRHLSGLGMTPEQYREKWNLPSDYPWLRRITRHSGLRWRSRSDLVRFGREPASAKSDGRSKADRTESPVIHSSGAQNAAHTDDRYIKRRLCT
jgi:predicted transcriptional regulator